MGLAADEMSQSLGYLRLIVLDLVLWYHPLYSQLESEKAI